MCIRDRNHAVRIAFIVLLAWGLLGASKCVELALVGTRSRFDPVSYTHLDVYKRQV